MSSRLQEQIARINPEVVSTHELDTDLNTTIGEFHSMPIRINA